MPKASDLKPGMIVDINGMPHVINKLESKRPSSRGAATLYKVRFNNLKTGQKLDESFKGEDMLKEADCQRTHVQFSYQDNDDFNFMDSEDYTQYTLNRDDLGNDVGYLSEGLEGITALIMDGAILGIELPQSVVLTIIETAPGIKGATGHTKPATLNTGFEIQVPEYLESGESIKINTNNGEFISRV